MSLAYRLTDSTDLDPVWNDEDEVQDWLEAELFAALTERRDVEVEWTLRRLLRDE